MIYPVVPSGNLPIIVTTGTRVQVARYIEVGTHAFEVQLADNWEALEEDARRVVEDQIGAITIDDHFPCPDDLAGRAVWPG